MPTPIPASWKPIESAPTLHEFSDGLHQYGPNILVFAAGKVTIARWWQTIDGSASNFIDRGSCAVHPTHWMPLPAAPGADTPEEPITVSLDPDPRGVSVGVWQGSSCIYTGAHAVPVAPGDAQDERQAFEAWAKRKKMPLARIGEQYDDFWVDHAWNGWQARARMAAPAAGDALDAQRYRWLRERSVVGMGSAHFGMFSTRKRDMDFLSKEEGLVALDAAIDAAIAAQQGKGGE